MKCDAQSSDLRTAAPNPRERSARLSGIIGAVGIFTSTGKRGIARVSVKVSPNPPAFWQDGITAHGPGDIAQTDTAAALGEIAANRVLIRMQSWRRLRDVHQVDRREIPPDENRDKREELDVVLTANGDRELLRILSPHLRVIVGDDGLLNAVHA